MIYILTKEPKNINKVRNIEEKHIFIKRLERRFPSPIFCSWALSVWKLCGCYPLQLRISYLPIKNLLKNFSEGCCQCALGWGTEARNIGLHSPSPSVLNKGTSLLGSWLLGATALVCGRARDEINTLTYTDLQRISTQNSAPNVWCAINMAPISILTCQYTL